MAKLEPYPWLTFTLLLLAISASPALAQDTIALGALDLYATIQSVSVIAPYTGDDNGNAVAHVEYRLGGAGAFVRGHALVPLAGKRLAGSVLFLEPDTEYEVRVVADDPDNGAPVAIQGTVRTRRNAPDPPHPSGTTWWVDAGSGQDTNPGTSGAPFRTIQRGADAAQPGDVVRVLPGAYHEQVVPPGGGTPGAPIWFLAHGEGVVIDGSDPALTSGATWNDAGGGLYWTPFVGETTYVAVDDTRIYDYQALADLQAENGNIGVPGAIRGGFYADPAAGRLYVITPDHSSPAGHAIHVAVRGSAFLLDTISDVVVEGFEMRYFGAAAGYGGVGVDVRDTARTWVRFNAIHHVNSAVRVRRAMASENVIEWNTFRDTGVWTWPWDSSKSHTPEASAISVVHGHGNVVRWNDLEGSFNGIYTGAFGIGDEEIARDTDVHENVLRLHADDGLELEGAQRNVRAWENRVDGVLNAISIAPVECGPAFLVRNLVRNYMAHAVKANNGTWGWVFLYHTTSLPVDGAVVPEAQAIAPPEPFGSVTTRNNIWEANRYVIEYIPTTFVGPVDWDRDDVFTWDVEGMGRYVKWLDVRYPDLASLQAGSTIEPGGFQVEPVYEDPAGGDFTLVAGHPLVDAGEVIPGINDRWFLGLSPDVGAFERGAPSPGPDPEWGDVLRADDPRKLPGSPDARFRNVRLPWTDPDTVLANPALPRILYYVHEPGGGPIGVAKDGESVRIELRS